MNEITIRDEYIKLGQALKLAGISENGSEAKSMIQEGYIRVNGEVETRRGRKLKAGDIFETDDDKFMIKL